MVAEGEDHDEIIRLAERLIALNALNNERDDLLVQRYDLSEKTLMGAIDRVRDEYAIGHRELSERVAALERSVAASSGTSTGTMRIFLVAAVTISLLGLVFSIVHALGE